MKKEIKIPLRRFTEIPDEFLYPYQDYRHIIEKVGRKIVYVKSNGSGPKNGYYEMVSDNVGRVIISGGEERDYELLIVPSENCYLTQELLSGYTKQQKFIFVSSNVYNSKELANMLKEEHRENRLTLNMVQLE